MELGDIVGFVENESLVQGVIVAIKHGEKDRHLEYFVRYGDKTQTSRWFAGYQSDFSSKQRRLTEMTWRKKLHGVCPHGLQIMLVDGKYVRDHYDSDFVQGGNGYRYRFVPRGELWVDGSMPVSEWRLVIYHECIEAEKMKGGMSYEKAHDIAKRAENRERRRLRHH